MLFREHFGHLRNIDGQCESDEGEEEDGEGERHSVCQQTERTSGIHHRDTDEVTSITSPSSLSSPPLPDFDDHHRSCLSLLQKIRMEFRTASSTSTAASTTPSCSPAEPPQQGENSSPPCSSSSSLRILPSSDAGEIDVVSDIPDSKTLTPNNTSAIDSAHSSSSSRSHNRTRLRSRVCRFHRRLRMLEAPALPSGLLSGRRGMCSEGESGTPPSTATPEEENEARKEPEEKNIRDGLNPARERDGNDDDGHHVPNNEEKGRERGGEKMLRGVVRRTNEEENSPRTTITTITSIDNTHYNNHNTRGSSYPARSAIPVWTRSRTSPFSLLPTVPESSSSQATPPLLATTTPATTNVVERVTSSTKEEDKEDLNQKNEANIAPPLLLVPHKRKGKERRQPQQQQQEEEVKRLKILSGLLSGRSPYPTPYRAADALKENNNNDNNHNVPSRFMLSGEAAPSSPTLSPMEEIVNPSSHCLCGTLGGLGEVGLLQGMLSSSLSTTTSTCSSSTAALGLLPLDCERKNKVRTSQHRKGEAEKEKASTEKEEGTGHQNTPSLLSKEASRNEESVGNRSIIMTSSNCTRRVVVNEPLASPSTPLSSHILSTSCAAPAPVPAPLDSSPHALLQSSSTHPAEICDSRHATPSHGGNMTRSSPTSPRAGMTSIPAASTMRRRGRITPGRPGLSTTTTAMLLSPLCQPHGRATPLHSLTRRSPLQVRHRLPGEPSTYCSSSSSFSAHRLDHTPARSHSHSHTPYSSRASSFPLILSSPPLSHRFREEEEEEEETVLLSKKRKQNLHQEVNHHHHKGQEVGRKLGENNSMEVGGLEGCSSEDPSISSPLTSGNDSTGSISSSIANRRNSNMEDDSPAQVPHPTNKTNRGGGGGRGRPYSKSLTPKEKSMNKHLRRKRKDERRKGSQESTDEKRKHRRARRSSSSSSPNRTASSASLSSLVAAVDAAAAAPLVSSPPLGKGTPGTSTLREVKTMSEKKYRKGALWEETFSLCGSEEEDTTREEVQEKKKGKKNQSSKKLVKKHQAVGERANPSSCQGSKPEPQRSFSSFPCCCCCCCCGGGYHHHYRHSPSSLPPRDIVTKNKTSQDTLLPRRKEDDMRLEEERKGEIHPPWNYGALKKERAKRKVPPPPPPPPPPPVKKQEEEEENKVAVVYDKQRKDKIASLPSTSHLGISLHKKKETRDHTKEQREEEEGREGGGRRWTRVKTSTTEEKKMTSSSQSPSPPIFSALFGFPVETSTRQHRKDILYRRRGSATDRENPLFHRDHPNEVNSITRSLELAVEERGRELYALDRQLHEIWCNAIHCYPPVVMGGAVGEREDPLHPPPSSTTAPLPIPLPSSRNHIHPSCQEGRREGLAQAPLPHIPLRLTRAGEWTQRLHSVLTASSSWRRVAKEVIKTMPMKGEEEEEEEAQVEMEKKECQKGEGIMAASCSCSSSSSSFLCPSTSLPPTPPLSWFSVPNLCLDSHQKGARGDPLKVFPSHKEEHQNDSRARPLAPLRHGIASQGTQANVCREEWGGDGGQEGGETGKKDVCHPSRHQLLLPPLGPPRAVMQKIFFLCKKLYDGEERFSSEVTSLIEALSVMALQCINTKSFSMAWEVLQRAETLTEKGAGCSLFVHLTPSHCATSPPQRKKLSLPTKRSLPSRLVLETEKTSWGYSSVVKGEANQEGEGEDYFPVTEGTAADGEHPPARMTVRSVVGRLATATTSPPPALASVEVVEEDAVMRAREWEDSTSSSGGGHEDSYQGIPPVVSSWCGASLEAQCSTIHPAPHSLRIPNNQTMMMRRVMSRKGRERMDGNEYDDTYDDDENHQIVHLSSSSASSSSAIIMVPFFYSDAVWGRHPRILHDHLSFPSSSCTTPGCYPPVAPPHTTSPLCMVHPYLTFATTMGRERNGIGAPPPAAGREAGNSAQEYKDPFSFSSPPFPTTTAAAAPFFLLPECGSASPLSSLFSPLSRIYSHKVSVDAEAGREGERCRLRATVEHNKGLYHFALGEYDDAIFHFTSAIELEETLRRVSGMSQRESEREEEEREGRRNRGWGRASGASRHASSHRSRKNEEEEGEEEEIASFFASFFSFSSGLSSFCPTRNAIATVSSSSIGKTYFNLAQSERALYNLLVQRSAHPLGDAEGGEMIKERRIGKDHFHKLHQRQQQPTKDDDDDDKQEGKHHFHRGASSASPPLLILQKKRTRTRLAKYWQQAAFQHVVLAEDAIEETAYGLKCDLNHIQHCRQTCSSRPPSSLLRLCGAVGERRLTSATPTRTRSASGGSRMGLMKGPLFSNAARVVQKIRRRRDECGTTITTASETGSADGLDALVTTRKTTVAQPSLSSSSSRNILRLWLRWREAVGFLSYVTQQHGQWLAQDRQYTSALVQFERSSQWMRSIEKWSTEEQERMDVLRRSVIECRKALRRQQQFTQHTVQPTSHTVMHVPPPSLPHSSSSPSQTTRLPSYLSPPPPPPFAPLSRGGEDPGKRGPKFPKMKFRRGSAMTIDVGAGCAGKGATRTAAAALVLPTTTPTTTVLPKKRVQSHRLCQGAMKVRTTVLPRHVEVIDFAQEALLEHMKAALGATSSSQEGGAWEAAPLRIQSPCIPTWRHQPREPESQAIKKREKGRRGEGGNASKVKHNVGLEMINVREDAISLSLDTKDNPPSFSYANPWEQSTSNDGGSTTRSSRSTSSGDPHHRIDLSITTTTREREAHKEVGEQHTHAQPYTLPLANPMNRGPHQVSSPPMIGEEEKEEHERERRSKTIEGAGKARSRSSSLPIEEDSELGKCTPNDNLSGNDGDAASDSKGREGEDCNMDIQDISSSPSEEGDRRGSVVGHTEEVRDEEPQQQKDEEEGKGEHPTHCTSEAEEMEAREGKEEGHHARRTFVVPPAGEKNAEKEKEQAVLPAYPPVPSSPIIPLPNTKKERTPHRVCSNNLSFTLPREARLPYSWTGAIKVIQAFIYWKKVCHDTTARQLLHHHHHTQEEEKKKVLVGEENEKGEEVQERASQEQGQDLRSFSNKETRKKEEDEENNVDEVHQQMKVKTDEGTHTKEEEMMHEHFSNHTTTTTRTSPLTTTTMTYCSGRNHNNSYHHQNTNSIMDSEDENIIKVDSPGDERGLVVVVRFAEDDLDFSLLQHAEWERMTERMRELSALPEEAKDEMKCPHPHYHNDGVELREVMHHDDDDDNVIPVGGAQAILQEKDSSFLVPLGSTIVPFTSSPSMGIPTPTSTTNATAAAAASSSPSLPSCVDTPHLYLLQMKEPHSHSHYPSPLSEVYPIPCTPSSLLSSPSSKSSCSSSGSLFRVPPTGHPIEEEIMVAVPSFSSPSMTQDPHSSFYPSRGSLSDITTTTTTTTTTAMFTTGNEEYHSSCGSRQYGKEKEHLFRIT